MTAYNSVAFSSFAESCQLILDLFIPRGEALDASASPRAVLGLPLAATTCRLSPSAWFYVRTRPFVAPLARHSGFRFVHAVAGSRTLFLPQDRAPRVNITTARSPLRRLMRVFFLLLAVVNVRAQLCAPHSARVRAA